MREERDLDQGFSSNGHSPNGHAPDKKPANPYAEAMIGARPPEIVEFELHTDPYANMVPRVSSMVTGGTEEDESTEPRRHNPVVIGISVILIAVLTLPVMVEVFARLIH
jgi:hypothetical protein